MEEVLGPEQEKKWHSGAYYFRGVLRVRYGNALPRFDSGWVYGDLHYHSQGTDNEGEVGIPYRAVIQAMKAMGLDFVFATEHASNSGQITDIDQIFATKLPDFIPGWLEDLILDWIKNVQVPYESSVDQLRDMSQKRFEFLRRWLHDPGGTNEEVLSTLGARVPQIFLGGEVDVIPEISAAERDAGWFHYGNRGSYPWAKACEQIPTFFKDALEKYTSFEICPEGTAGLVEEASEGGRYLLRDVQGLGSAYFARQHFVHLPDDPTRDDAFIGSDTTHYGGGFNRLKDILTEDYATAHKGYLFLAHPVEAASGSGPGRLGPDLVPYSDTQLETAFGSRHVLGLQLWNEDQRLNSEPDVDPTEWDFGFPHSLPPGGLWPLGLFWNGVWG